jgi:hypothetical protein
MSIPKFMLKYMPPLRNHTTSRKRGLLRLQEQLVTSRRGQVTTLTGLCSRSRPTIVMDKSRRTMTGASENSSTFRCGRSSTGPADVSIDMQGERDSAGASAASVECLQ